MAITGTFRIDEINSARHRKHHIAGSVAARLKELHIFKRVKTKRGKRGGTKTKLKLQTRDQQLEDRIKSIPRLIPGATNTEITAQPTITPLANQPNITKTTKVPDAITLLLANCN